MKNVWQGRLKAPKFIADSNVGKLARRLRMLGFDALYIHPIADDLLVEIAQLENRVILTRDTYIFHRRVVFDGQVPAVMITHDDVRDQVRQVLRELVLGPPFPLFSRCLECNAPLRPLGREQAESLVPPYVYRTQREFTICPRCGRVYWAGTHRQHMLEEVESLGGEPDGTLPPEETEEE
ncbi:MAG TPA: Mut7-C RNAse domain-containing protein [Chloroflexota bacterium]|nr:Mut7-C RNAse domain-containing protein [Chloroflexota bacterium]